MGLIRLLLAFSVVLDHSTRIYGNGLVGGRGAVESFFMISGFYMALVLSEKYGRIPGWRNRYAVFFRSRLLRLFPIYFVVLIVTVVTYWLLGLLTTWQSGAVSDSTLAFFALVNVTVVGQDVVTFLGIHSNGGIFLVHDIATIAHGGHEYLLVPQAWSLSLELVFYAMAPWIVRRSTRVVVLVGLISVSVRGALWGAGLSADPWSYRFFPSELMFFLVGVLAYRAFARYRASALTHEIRRRTGAAALSLVVLIVFGFGYVSFPAQFVVLYTVIAVSLPLVFEFSKRSVFDRFLGDLSYPLYISHVFVISIVAQFRPVSGGAVAPPALATAIVLLLVVDRPIERFRQRRVRGEIDAVDRDTAAVGLALP